MMELKEKVNTEELVEKNLNLVKLIVNQKFRAVYENRKTSKLDFDDLFQIGCIGLIRASKAFDPERGFKFTTYAGVYIEGDILRFLRDHHQLVKFPREIYTLAMRYKKLNLEDKTKEEALKISGFTEKEYEDAQAYWSANRAFSFDKEMGGMKDDSQESPTYHELLSEEMDYSQMEVDRFFSQLNERERIIIKMTLEHKSQSEIAKVVGVSQVHVSRLIKGKIAEQAKKYFQLEVTK